MASGFKLTGFHELSRAIGKLPEELRKSAESPVLRAGAKPILAAAKAKVPKSKGTKANGLLKKSLGITVRKSRGTKQKTARVGVRAGFKVSLGTAIARVTKGKRVKGQPYEKFKDPRNYAHLVEYGTSKTPARSFIRAAVESEGDSVAEAMAAGLDKHLTKAVAKLRIKGGGA